MKTLICGLSLVAGLTLPVRAQYAVVYGATPLATPAPAPATVPVATAPVANVPVATAPVAVAPTPTVVQVNVNAPAYPVVPAVGPVSYSAVGYPGYPAHPGYGAYPGYGPYSGYQGYPCGPAPHAIYHVPAPNVVYFGRPESYLKNYLNNPCRSTHSSVVYFGRGESYERGYYFNAWR